MVERLTALDASFLYLEERDTPMHVGGVLLLEAPPDGIVAIESLVAARLPLVPRYRQRVLEVPAHLADPVWADDRDFDVDYHVRRSALPRPGTEAQLLELVSRLMSRPLDRRRPLLMSPSTWEKISARFARSCTVISPSIWARVPMAAFG